MALIELENTDLVNISTKQTIISKINMKIDKGEFVLITGINGVGKSSLFKALLEFKGNNEEKYAEFQNGNYYFCDSLEKNDLNMQIINIPQEDYISRPLTRIDAALMEAIPFTVKNKKEYLDNWINKYKPFTADDLNKNILKKRVISLSGGEKKYIAIIQGLIRCDDPNVKLALIDEPINNLDTKHIIQLSDLCSRIKCINKDFTFIIISHCHAFPRIDKAYEIDDGLMKLVEYQTHNCFGKVDIDGFYQSEMNPKNGKEL